MTRRWLSTMILGLAAVTAHAGEPSATAHYLANEGVMVARGETKVLFDPLFRYPHDYYQAVPPELEAAIFAGEPPFDGVDAVFISHYHADHFSPELILRLLREQKEIRLYAPAQAVEGLTVAAGGGDETLFERVTAIDLEYWDEPVTFEAAGLLVEATRIPHSGWPDARLEVQNIAFRVTLNSAATVLHMGDADARDRHFAKDSALWKARRTDMAFPPYWYFLAPEGRSVLEERLQPGHSVGVHIPADPAERPEALAEFDVFTEPGDTREISRRRD